ncbi:hypothetical protein D16iCDA_02065 [Pseudomonas seleniipraecipitans]|uniref:Uncharacterized protein n=1 Tax=Phytopseudomonas seleniipraecipitans TaxID=640205 RepID=A0ABY5J8Y2_9GAMM|nr:hypothetical protein [Pseudomonas seleniipraecipitans]UUD64514.1 hypothetical protein D16iCDA_02065 [Pseudomonas seleniipraecipitans]
MSNLQTYQFGVAGMRVVDIKGKPRFVAIDACRAIGYSTKADGSVNTTNALRAL